MPEAGADVRGRQGRLRGGLRGLGRAPRLGNGSQVFGPGGLGWEGGCSLTARVGFKGGKGGGACRLPMSLLGFVGSFWGVTGV